MVPELSAALVPPKRLRIPPSGSVPSGRLMEAAPTTTTLPQSPYLRLPAAWAEVKTIGLVCVPSARILAPRSITSVPSVVKSPKIFVPAGTVSVLPLVMHTLPWSKYFSLARRVRLVVISPERITRPVLSVGPLVAVTAGALASLFSQLLIVAAMPSTASNNSLGKRFTREIRVINEKVRPLR